jgi:hypothetical protein
VTDSKEAFAERHPNLLTHSRVQWALRNRARNGLSSVVYRRRENGVLKSLARRYSSVGVEESLVRRPKTDPLRVCVSADLGKKCKSRLS